MEILILLLIKMRSLLEFQLVVLTLTNCIFKQFN